MDKLHLLAPGEIDNVGCIACRITLDLMGGDRIFDLIGLESKLGLRFEGVVFVAGAIPFEMCIGTDTSTTNFPPSACVSATC